MPFGNQNKIKSEIVFLKHSSEFIERIVLKVFEVVMTNLLYVYFQNSYGDDDEDFNMGECVRLPRSNLPIYLESFVRGVMPGAKTGPSTTSPSGQKTKILLVSV